MKKRKMKCIIMTAIASLVTISAMAAPPGTGWSVSWRDEFNTSSVSGSKWKITNKLDWNKGGVKSWFYPANVKATGNALSIENHWRNSPGPNGELYSGGWIETWKKFSHLSYFECRSRLDWTDNHFWPTFWMWEWTSNNHHNEFDIMQYTHWHTTPTQDHVYPTPSGGGTNGKQSGQSVSQYAKWGLLWTWDKVSFYVNDVPNWNSPKPTLARNDQIPMIFSCSPNRENNPARNGTYPRFFVDWVRVHTGGNPNGGGGGSGAPIGKIIALKSKGSGKFVQANGNAAWTLRATNGAVGGAWEKFACVDAGGGYIGLKSLGSNKYVKANGAGTNWKLQAINNNIGGSWEKFQWMPQSDGSIALKSQGSGKYVKANGPASGWTLHAINNNVGGSWEKFTWSQQ